MQRGILVSDNKVQLYNTVVAERLARTVVKIKTDGFNTRSTCKAINTAFKKWGITGINVGLRQGIVTACYSSGEEVAINSQGTVICTGEVL